MAGLYGQGTLCDYQTIKAQASAPAMAPPAEKTARPAALTSTTVLVVVGLTAAVVPVGVTGMPMWAPPSTVLDAVEGLTPVPVAVGVAVSLSDSSVSEALLTVTEGLAVSNSDFVVGVLVSGADVVLEIGADVVVGMIISLLVVVGLGSSLTPLHGSPVLGSRYQFEAGSPRQSPIVVNSKPFSLAVSIMNWTKPLTVNVWISWAKLMKEVLAGLALLMAPEKVAFELTPLSTQSLVSRL